MSVEHTTSVMERYWSVEGDLEAIAADAVFIDMATGRRFEGREAIGEMLNFTYQQAFDGAFNVAYSHIGDGFAVIEGRFTGTHIGEFNSVPATDKEVDVPLTVHYSVGDEGITEGRVWFMLSTFHDQVS